MGGLNFFILTVVGLAVGASVFFGVIAIAKKSFHTPPQEHLVDSTQMLRDQRDHIEDIQRRQKDLMRDQQQKIRDLQRMQRKH